MLGQRNHTNKKSQILKVTVNEQKIAQPTGSTWSILHRETNKLTQLSAVKFSSQYTSLSNTKGNILNIFQTWHGGVKTYFKHDTGVLNQLFIFLAGGFFSFMALHSFILSIVLTLSPGAVSCSPHLYNVIKNGTNVIYNNQNLPYDILIPLEHQNVRITCLFHHTYRIINYSITC